MKKQSIKKTDKSAFFKLLNRAAHPQSQSGGKTSAPQSAGGYGGKQTRSNTSANAAKKRGGKSH